MHVFLFSFAALCRLSIAIKLIRRKWLTKLPCFVLMIAASILHSLVVLYIRATGTLEQHEAFHAACSPWVALLRTGAALEAFAWFAYSLPRFRRPGLLTLALCLTAGLCIDLIAEPSRPIGGWLSRLEVWSALGLGASLLTACFLFELIGEANQSAIAHGTALTTFFLLHGVGWALYRVGWWQAGGNVVVMASPIMAYLWLLNVNEPPKWKAPLPKRADWGALVKEWEDLRYRVD
jgi:hypothetical protein